MGARAGKRERPRPNMDQARSLDQSRATEPSSIYRVNFRIFVVRPATAGLPFGHFTAPVARYRLRLFREEISESATHVFVKPVDRALPGQIGRGFVIPFRRRVAIEAMSCARI